VGAVLLEQHEHWQLEGRRSPRPLQWCNSLGLSPGVAGAERAHLRHLAQRLVLQGVGRPVSLV
jgi:hypothetical protein